jgi:hypothetical protein
VVYKGVSEPREAHFTAICWLGNSNIALLMVKTGSISGVVDTKDLGGYTPLVNSAGRDMKEVVTALFEAKANIIRPAMIVLPLCTQRVSAVTSTLREFFCGTEQP